MFGRIFVVSFLSWIFCFPLEAAPQVCTYTTWSWNKREMRSVGHRRVQKLKSDLTPLEKDPHSKCTVCEEDQVLISIKGAPSFKACKYYAKEIKALLKKSIKEGLLLNQVIGYRVGKTKGPLDEKGLRTQFSHHSFGTAVDINSDSNGLYGNCLVFSPQCQLLRGGPWNPKNPKSISKNSSVYREFKKIGWNWGGELNGYQKDFMHFSIKGD